MAGALDSKAFFFERVGVIGLGDVKDRFIELGWDSMANFAFSANYVPGRSDDTPLIDDVVVPLLGDRADPRKAKVRRLFFEAYAMAAQDVTRRVSQPDADDKPKKLPLAERAARFSEMETTFVGLNLRGDLEPANSLVDKFVEMHEFNELRYLKWEELTKRSQEARGMKKEPMWQEDNTGSLKRIYMDGTLTIQIDDMLNLRYALQRRGVAMHLSKLLSYKVHEQLVQLFFDEMNREALPDHAKVSINQVRNADREVFLKLADLTRGGFTSIGLVEDALPLDAHLQKTLTEHRVMALLLPLALPSGHRQQGEKRQSSENNQLREEIKRLKASGHKPERAFNNAGGQSSKQKGKGKSRGDKTRQSSKPKDLIGMNNELNGEKLCYNFNLPKKCSRQSDDRCDRGLHRCMFPGCGKSHPLTHCSSKGSSR